MRYLKPIIIVICLAMPFAGSSSAQEAGPGNLEKSVVMIRSASQDFDYLMPWKQKQMSQGIGSGFVIEGNRILTNAHNVSNNKYIEIKKTNVAKRYPARVAFIGHDCDLAIITVYDQGFFDDTVLLELAGIPKVNTTVSTYGFPVGGTRISVTEGVVSRIQLDFYSHSGADSHLVVQTDAAINPGNSGGPVMQAGQVVGVAFQGLMQAENIGYLIPTTVIKHFLADIEDGKYDGFGSLGVTLYPGLHSAAYKEYLKVPPGEEGVVVLETMMHSSVESILQAGDVITRIDDYNIDNDGMIKIYGLTLDLAEVIETKQIGRKIQLTFYRDGELMKEDVDIRLNRPIFEYARQYDTQPRYVCFAGLVFTEATRNYLETWGRDWLTNIPHQLKYLFHNSMQLNTDRRRKRYIVLSQILPDQLNSYAVGYKAKPLESINGIAIYDMDDVYQALGQPIEGFHIIKFVDSDRILPIDAEQAANRRKEILDKYQVPAGVHLEQQL